MFGHIRTELLGDSITKVMPHLTSGANKTTYDIAAALVELEYQLCKNAKLRAGSNVSYVKDVKT